ncbi:hypothetical protein B0H10DRAFT_2091831 [Mycena sp. CBHHK59/15]|nr:hypothetical protein B0H10DRAFT_2091831 [Mycena sp. CBHHK59/15]
MFNILVATRFQSSWVTALVAGALSAPLIQAWIQDPTVRDSRESTDTVPRLCYRYRDARASVCHAPPHGELDATVRWHSVKSIS